MAEAWTRDAGKALARIQKATDNRAEVRVTLKRLRHRLPRNARKATENRANFGIVALETRQKSAFCHVPPQISGGGPCLSPFFVLRYFSQA